MSLKQISNCAKMHGNIKIYLLRTCFRNERLLIGDPLPTADHSALSLWYILKDNPIGSRGNPD